MIDYEPDSFFARTLKRFPETWSIVSSPEACLLMRDMAKIEHPAVDALHHLPSFCQLVMLVDSEKSTKQSANFRNMVGQMCKRVMYHLGYEFVRNDVPTRLSSIFTNGAVYRLPR